MFFHNVGDDIDDTGNLLAAPSIIGLFRRSGFETWWLSNQTANSDGLTGTALFAEDADHRSFFNKSRHEGNSVSYDEVFLDAVEKALAMETPRKAIFVHLLGSHLSYGLRYPSEFNVFTSIEDIPDASFRTSEHKKYVNQYDNSIRYTDYIVVQLIELVKKCNENSFVVYFSDHGQEVYDTLPIKGQDARNPTRHMFGVPFIVWLSERYAQRNHAVVDILQEKKHTPISLEHFADMASWLARITFDGYNEGRNAFSPKYIQAVRMIPYGKR